MKTLSISVAAYNMEKLIRQNLDSFVSSPAAQDVEVLVVNDGSKDSTAEIVREYERRFPGIVRLIDQPNAGPGSTVNRGLEHAQGKYFRMVDADDWVDAGFAEYVQALKETSADMVLTDYTMVDDKTGEQRLCRVDGIAAGQTLDFDGVCGGLLPVMHAVTYRTQLLKDNGIRLFNGFYTDMQYLLFPAPFVQTVLYVPCNVYMYRVSLTGQSMSAASMQRNIGMHTDVLFSLLSLYNDVRSARPAVADYILRRAVIMAGAQLGTLLSFAPSRAKKQELFAFFARMKAECADVYAAFARLKTVRVLNLFGGAFYRPVSKMHRKKLGLEGS